MNAMEAWRNRSKEMRRPAAAVWEAWRLPLLLGIIVGVGAGVGISPVEGISAVLSSRPGTLWGTGGDGTILGVAAFMLGGLYGAVQSRSFGQEFSLGRTDTFLGGFLVAGGAVVILGGCIFTLVGLIVGSHLNPSYLASLAGTTVVLGAVAGLMGGLLALRARRRRLPRRLAVEPGRLRKDPKALDKVFGEPVRAGNVALNVLLALAGFLAVVLLVIAMNYGLAQGFQWALPFLPRSLRTPVLFGTLIALTLGLTVGIAWVLYHGTGEDTDGHRF